MKTRANPNLDRAAQGLRVLWAGLILLTMAALTNGAGAEGERTENIQGTWTCLTAVVNGKPLPEATVNLFRLILTKDRYKTTKGAETLFESSYTLDNSHTPHHINIVGTEGDLAGKQAQGIYALSGDALKICYTMPGGTRPLAFESTAGSEVYFMVWQRQKP